ncbi:Hsp20/alpha crystallin family protein [Dyadobacter fermentans]|uniref:Hsp20/alpha crystallin family protein n=1 Tax=Dyadobacter fermentans TaxID=94254 RepID=UPI001CBE1341|nr:Hsp20/alpha crystallin family protein [Dyadobacter fermentans]MBZ1358087.1 Hsp20/alpha crystallin family protein [Dyadobacter fermentans]
MCDNRFGRRGFGMRHDYYGRHLGPQREFRVPVNIVRNEDSYQMLIFAPDRNKEDFKINVQGLELTISYELKDNLSEKRNWIRQEFSKSSFQRTFMIDNTVDTENISAQYHNGILQLTLPIVPGSEKAAQEINVS